MRSTLTIEIGHDSDDCGACSGRIGHLCSPLTADEGLVVYLRLHEDGRPIRHPRCLAEAQPIEDDQ